MGALSEVVRIAIFFFLLFTSYLSFQNIVTQLYEQIGQPSLGKLSLFTLYASFMVGGLVAPFISKRINFKKLFVFGALCYTVNFSSGIVLHFVGASNTAVLIVLLLAMVGGSTAALIWTAQGAYIHFVCEQHGVQAKKGYYFGVFYAIFSLSNITSGLITTFLLGFFDILTYFIVLVGIGLFAMLFSIVAIPNVQQRYARPIRESESVVLIEPAEGNEAGSTEKILPAIIRVFRFYPKMTPLLPSIGLVGIAIAFYASSLHQILGMALPPDATKEYINLRTGIMFLILGVGEISGGYVSGRLSDKLGIQKVGAIALSCFYIAAILSQVALTYNNTVVPVMLAAFFWGFQEAYIQNWITVVCSRTYKGALQAFVINKQFHSLTLCLYEVMLMLLHPPLALILPLLFGLGLLCLLALPFIREPASDRQIFHAGIQSVGSEESAQ